VGSQIITLIFKKSISEISLRAQLQETRRERSELLIRPERAEQLAHINGRISTVDEDWENNEKRGLSVTERDCRIYLFICVLLNGDVGSSDSGVYCCIRLWNNVTKRVRK
jgi:hypothetical protein